MEVRWPKVSTFFLGDGSAGASACFCCGSACPPEAKPRRKLAAIVFSSESYISFSTTVLSALSAEICGGAAEAGAATEPPPPPRKSSNLGPPVRMERLVGDGPRPKAPSFGSGEASTVPLPEKHSAEISVN